MMANQTLKTSPALFANILKAFGEGVQLETVDHDKLKEISEAVKP